MLTMLKSLLLQLVPIIAVKAPTDSELSQAVSNSPITDGSSSQIVKFYQEWGPHLHLTWGMFRKMAGWFQSVPVHWIYDFNRGFEKIFTATFSLLGWDGTLSSKGSPLHGLYVVMSSIGWALLGAALIVIVLQSLGHAVKWGKILPNVLMVALTLTVLPLMMRTVSGAGSTSGVGNVAVSARKDLNAASDKGMTDDLAIQPIKNNIIDLSTVVRHGWQENPDRLNISKLNTISDENDVSNLDFGEYLDKDTLKNLGLDKDPYKNYTAPLQYHLNDESKQTGGGYILVKNATGVGAGSNNDDVYARYDVDWMGLLGQSIILGVILLIASIRVVKDIFELTAMNLVAPILAFQSVRSPKKLRDLVNSIVGLYLSMVLIVLVLKMFFIFIAVAPTKLPTDMTWITHALAVIVIYAGAGYAMLAGISYFERVTGVSQGFADESGHAMAAGAMGGAMAGMGARAAGWGFSKVSSFGKNSSKGIYGNNGSNNSHNQLHDSNSNTALGNHSQNSHGINDNDNLQNNSANHNVSQNAANNHNATGINSNTQNADNSSENNNSGQTDANVDNNADNSMNNNPYDATNYDQQGDTIDGPATGIGSSDELSEEAGYGNSSDGQGIGEVSDENAEDSDQNLDGQPGAYEDPTTASGIEPETDSQGDQPYADSEMGSGIGEPGVDGQNDQPYADSEMGSGIGEPGVDGQGDQPYADSEMGSGIGEPGVDGQGDQPYADSEMGSGIAEPGVDGQGNQPYPGSEMGSGINGSGTDVIDQEAYGHSGNAQPGLVADHGINGEAPNKFDMSEKAHQSAEPTGTVEPTRGGYEHANGNAGYADQGAAPSVAPSINNEKAPDTKTVTHDMPETAIEKPSVSQRINQAGKKLEKSSTSYLSSRRFNMSQRGHVSGRESAPFEDDE
ncbi:pLS20_p028 family conjugation system transmembrane protein [Limosilactobacillus mucosae]|uniref:pLS20_p028 family conjugation system transmembrane protein n=1 Tax=Limosilactobacillus mucosae TaxID=97478 RepID=UPI0025A45ACB|nr:hypothetical protein [Limosilactobacillus mucosae]MDM8220699.1 hypothetical protein [Limosilactobacillus mucosae]